MKRVLLFSFLFLIIFAAKAQNNSTDVPDIDKIDINEPNNNSNIRTNRIQRLDPAVTEEKEKINTGPVNNDLEPEFPGGKEAFRDYIGKNVKYLPSVKNFRGKILVSFVIESNGRVTNAKIVNGAVTDLMKKEILQVFENSPVWEPGIQNNRAVRVLYTMPITF